MRVSLVGVSCVGTTTIGRILADRRGWPFFDLDEEIERHFGTSIERLQAGAWSEELADSYLALGRVDDAVRTIGNATRCSYADGAEMLCELAEKLMRSGHQPQARALWQQARAGYPDDVWIYVQAGIEYGDMGDHTEALEWLTTGLELVLRTGDPDSALEQLHPLRASCLSALGRQSDEIQERAAQRKHV